jgi:predicted amidophosphoribosyltransferase
MKAIIRDVLLDAAGLLLPTACAGCGAPGRSLCDRCRLGLVPDVLSRVLADGTRVWSGLAYDGVARRAILALKEQGRTGLAAYLAPALAAAAQAAGAPGSTLVDAVWCPIPPSAAARRRRGYDPLRLVLRHARLDAVDLLRPGRAAGTQKGLARAERSANRRGAFSRGDGGAGLPVILVDDVVTTGSTLVEAARVLRADGIEVLGAIVIAATPLRYGRPATLPENRL